MDVETMECPECGKDFELPDSQHEIICPHCGAVMDEPDKDCFTFDI